MMNVVVFLFWIQYTNRNVKLTVKTFYGKKFSENFNQVFSEACENKRPVLYRPVFDIG